MRKEGVPKFCPDCRGTGIDEKKTIVARKQECDSHCRIRCWMCNGNGLNPDYFFRWYDDPLWQHEVKASK